MPYPLLTFAANQSTTITRLNFPVAFDAQVGEALLATGLAGAGLAAGAAIGSLVTKHHLAKAQAAQHLQHQQAILQALRLNQAIVSAALHAGCARLQGKSGRE